MRYVKFLVCFLCIFMFSEKAFSTVPLLEWEEESSRPLFSGNRPLSREDAQEMEDIYGNIFMQYGSPMLLHSYPLLPEKEQRNVIKALSQDFGIEKIIKGKVAERFGTKYKVQFVPETVFQMATLLQIAELTIRWNKGDEKARNLIMQLQIDGEPSVLVNLLLGNFPEREVSAEERATKLAIFLRNTYGEINLFPSVRTLYLQVCSLLSKKFGRELTELEHLKSQETLEEPDDLERSYRREQTLIGGMVEELMKDYRSLAGIFDLALWNLGTTGECLFFWPDYNNASYLWPYPGVERNTANLFMNPYHLPTVTKAAITEYEASRKNKILLLRAENGVQAMIQNVALGNTSDSGTYFNETSCYVLGGVSRSLGQEQGSGDISPLIRRVTGLVSFSPTVSGRTPSKNPYSSSYGTTYYAGTARDPGENGARVIDYRENPGTNGVICLGIPIEYLLKFPNGTPIRISLLNPVASFISKGEFFHSRSLVQIDTGGLVQKVDGNKYPEWLSIIRGFPAGGGKNDVLLGDARSKLGYLLFQGSGLEYIRELQNRFILSCLFSVDPGLDTEVKKYEHAVTPRDSERDHGRQTQMDKLNIPSGEGEWSPYLNLAAQVSQESLNGAAAGRSTLSSSLNPSLGGGAAAAAAEGASSSASKYPLDGAAAAGSEPVFQRPMKTDTYLHTGAQKRIHDIVNRARAIIEYGTLHKDVMGELSQRVKRYEDEIPLER